MAVTSNSDVDEALEYKEKGNACLKEDKYEEAILHYSHAIKLDPENASLYSNRSLAFLKIKQYYYAHEDAIEAIRLKPDWAKGYFRKGEAEAATYHYEEALLSYRCANELSPNDPVVIDALARTSVFLDREKKVDEKVSWLGAGIGLIFGVIIVLSDQVLTTKPAVNHPLVMAVLAISKAVIGYALAKVFRHYVLTQKKSGLEPPADLLKEKKNEENDVDESNNSSSNQQRFTKAQGRLKLRKGKT